MRQIFSSARRSGGSSKRTGRKHVRRTIIVLTAIAIVAGAILLVEFAANVFFSYRTDAGAVTTKQPPSGPEFSPSGNAPTASFQNRRDVPNLIFVDGARRSRSLSDFQGKLVLLNIWATWCGPCRREMPTLDRLQGALGGPDFEVVALSIDRAGLDVVRDFYSDIGVRNLAIYLDSSGKSASRLGVHGLPATLLIDREGLETDRHIGPAEWDTAEIKAFLLDRLAGNPGVLASAISDEPHEADTVVTSGEHEDADADIPKGGNVESRSNQEGTPE